MLAIFATCLIIAYGVIVGAPLGGYPKARVVALARQFGVPFDKTWSCYQPMAGGVQCGTCNSCMQFARALVESDFAALTPDAAGSDGGKGGDGG